MQIIKSRSTWIALSLVLFSLLAFQNCSKSFVALEKGEGSSASLGLGFYSDAQITEATFAKDSDLQCLRFQDYTFSIPKSLKYFGMLPSTGEDVRDFEKWKQQINATLKMGNTQVIEIWDTGDDDQTVADFKRRADYIYPYRHSIIVVLQQVFFARATGQLKSNYTPLWNKISAVMKSYSVNPFIAMYLYDEPYWNAQLKGIPSSDLTQQLNVAGQAIKASLPGMPLIFMEAYTMVNNQMIIPDIFDWVGADCYTEDCNGSTIFQLYEIIKAKLKPHQKLVVIPTAFVFKEPNQFTKADGVWLKDQFIKYAQWLAAQTNVIASVSFLYSLTISTEKIIAAENFCDSTDIHKIYSRQFQRSR